MRREATTAEIRTAPERLPSRIWIACAALVAAAGATVVGLEPGLLRFDPVSVPELTQIVTPLVLLALFMERAIEVVVSAWREGQREVLELECETPDIPDEELAALRRSLSAHRDETRCFAFLANVTLGVVVSTLGVRALELLVDADMLAALDAWQRSSFTVLDVLVTGALLAGGADGLHKVIATFTTFMEQSSRRIRSAGPRP